MWMTRQKWNKDGVQGSRGTRNVRIARQQGKIKVCLIKLHGEKKGVYSEITEE